MRVCIFGAGSIGSCLGGMLARDHEVTLIGRKANVDAISANGLILEGVVGRRIKIGARESVANMPPPDLLIVTTKAYATADVIETCKEWTHGDTIALTLQNGLGNLEQLRSWKGERAIGGTTTMGASMVSPGVVQVADLGKTILGSDLSPASAKSIASVLRVSGIPARTTRQIRGEIWSKAIVNASINPVSAILRLSNGELIKSETVSRLMMDICGECELVAEGCGIRLPHKSTYLWTRSIARRTASNRSSMLRDIELGRRTEIRNINGEICRMGRDLAIPTPLNAALISVVESLEKRKGGERLIS